ncbi:MAG: sigma-70 family RNA polymerase sigma factor, partial [Candidatus Binatia bacterium]
LGRFLDCLSRGDVAGVEALLTEDVRALSDGGGEFLAARVPVLGRNRVARMYVKLSKRRLEGAEFRVLNGLPALLAQFGTGLPKEARRITLGIDLAPDGRIREIHTVLATRKLSAVR